MIQKFESDKAYLYQALLNVNHEDEFRNLKTKLEIFEGVTEISQARKIAKDLFHIENDINFIKIENANCVIIQSANLFRVCLENDKEFICYNIISKIKK